MILLQHVMYFSYSQIIVADKSAELEVSMDWREDHVNQGFARRDSIVSFCTMGQFGDADLEVEVVDDPNLPDLMQSNFTRIISVPFFAKTGEILIIAMEELDAERSFSIAVGYYRLISCQRSVYKVEYLGEESKIEVRLLFQKLPSPLMKSELLKIDDKLKPPSVLLESAELNIV